MTYSITSVFSALMKNYVNLDPQISQDGKISQNWLVENQIAYFPTRDVKFPLFMDSFKLSFGSYSRKTKIRELDDIDTMIILHAVAHNEQYRKLINNYMLRHKMKPGITGWAQINGWRGETETLDKMEKRVEFDLEYIKNWSLTLDFKIIFLTLFKGFIHKSAY